MPQEEKAYRPFVKFAFLLALAVIVAVAVLIWQRNTEAAEPLSASVAFDIGTVVWSNDPSPVKALRNNKFTLLIETAEGAPLQGASASMLLDMIGMDCADVAFELSEVSPGVYEGEGMPLMAGAWKATLSLEAEGESYKVVHRVKVTY